MQLLQVVTAYSAAAPVMAAPGQPAVPGRDVGAARRPSDVEAVRQQLDTASRQLAANLDDSWKTYLALPPDVYTPNQVPNLQAIQQATARYEEVARRPEYAALQARPDFQATLQSLRRLSEMRTAANTTLQLPPPPR